MKIFCWRTWFSFRGHVNSSDYGKIMGVAIAIWLLSKIVRNAGTTSNSMAPELILSINISTIIVGVAAGVAIFAALAKRFRDAGKSPWWCLLNLVPLINIIAWIVAGYLKTDIDQPENES